MRSFLTSLLLVSMWSYSTTCHAIYDVIVDDTQAIFADEFGADMVTVSDPNAIGGSYRYIDDWGDSTHRSETVNYPLHGLPAGNHLYEIYAYVPSQSYNQWHVANIAGDGTQNLQQDISWSGSYSQNMQWLKLDPANIPSGGGWVKLGPGPQSDSTVDGGYAVYMNPSSGHGEPYVYFKYQYFYIDPIAFDAIRVVQIDVPQLVGDLNNDGFVGQADLNLILAHWGQTVPIGDLSQGDWSTDGFVGQADLNAVLGHWGQGTPPVHSVVPEPSTLLLSGVAGLVLLVCARRRVRIVC